MHQTPHPHQEKEANTFAGALLMPENEIIYDFDQPSLRRFTELKSYWGTSIQALVYRAWQIGKITDRQFRYFWNEIRSRWRNSEPNEPLHFIEDPTTLRWVIEAHLHELGYSADDLGDLFGLQERELKHMYPIAAPRPKLRLVKN